SFTPFGRKSVGKIIAAATNGPAHAPFPTSSVPATKEYPAVRKAFSSLKVGLLIGPPIVRPMSRKSKLIGSNLEASREVPLSSGLLASLEVTSKYAKKRPVLLEDCREEL